MPENTRSELHALPKRHPKRNAMAQRILDIRSHDRALRYSVDKNEFGYIQYLKGLGAFFDYVRELPVKRVLDIGSGWQVGIDKLQKEKMAKDIRLESTIATNRNWLRKNRQIPTHITSAELLKGIPDHSFGGILALNSIAYSHDPEAAIARIDQVLIPGGVLKAAFANSMGTKELGGDNTMGYKTYDEFVDALKARKYDVATMQVGLKEIDPTSGGFLPDVLVAIKPGAASKITAQELLKEDNYKWFLQIAEIRHERGEIPQ